jgi:hypothetical protein
LYYKNHCMCSYFHLYRLSVLMIKITQTYITNSCTRQRGVLYKVYNSQMMPLVPSIFSKIMCSTNAILFIVECSVTVLHMASCLTSFLYCRCTCKTAKSPTIWLSSFSSSSTWDSHPKNALWSSLKLACSFTYCSYLDIAS